MLKPKGTKVRTTMKVFQLLTLFVMIFLFNPVFSQAQLSGVYFQSFPNSEGISIEEVSTALAAQRDESSGLSIVGNREALGMHLIAANTTLENREQRSFEIGDLLILCFTATEDSQVQLIDIRPNDAVQRIFPKEEETVTVIADTTYCLGDVSSSQKIYADEATGLGRGTLMFRSGKSTSIAEFELDDAWGKVLEVQQVGNRSIPEGEAVVFETWLGYEMLATEVDLTASGDPETVTATEGQSIEVVEEVVEIVQESNCIEGQIKISYLQRIALLDIAKMTLLLSPCGNSDIIEASERVFYLQGEQVPVTVNLRCMSAETVQVNITQNDVPMFQGQTSCEELIQNSELLLNRSN